MELRQSIFGWESDKDQVWMVDRYHMGQIRLEHYFIRDGFSEYSGRFGYSSVYFWQSKTDPSCTVKVHAAATDSNARAHEAMKQFKSRIPDPGIMTKLDKSVAASEWFKVTHAEEVYFLNSDSEEQMVVLIWGNIFFQIESIGERNHSIKPFLQDLGNNWVTMQSDPEQKAGLQLTASATGFKPGDEVSLFRSKPDDPAQYSMYVYIAGPKEQVEIYRKSGDFRLKFKSAPEGSETGTSGPYALVIGTRPDGKFVRSNVVRFETLSE